MYNEYNGGGLRSPYPKSPSVQFTSYNTLPSAASTSTQCSFDLLKGKVEHLENERINLSLQIQDQAEKDRSKKIKIDVLESELKLSQAAQCSLKIVGEETQLKLKSLIDCNEELRLEIEGLNERIKVQAKEASGTKNFWTKMTAADRELKRLEDEALKSRRERVDMETEMEELSYEKNKLLELNEKRLDEMTSLRLEIEDQRRILRESKLMYENQKASSSNELLAAKSAAQDAIESKESAEETFFIKRNDLLQEIDALTKELAVRPKVDDDVESGDAQEMLDTVAIGDLRKKLLESEAKRKQLHNALQELRGNIRVFVRCRPFLDGDNEDDINIENLDPNVGGCVRFHKDGTSVSLAPTTTTSTGKAPQIFNFDQVFKCDSSQEDVFKEVQDLVQSALDGYKVCIFSYGQTGSGKTHTMTGDKVGHMRGIIPRSVEQIVEQVVLMRESGWEIIVTASMVEIYNEDLRDLLSPGTGASATSQSAADKDKDKNKLKISNLQGFVTISGLTAVELNTHDLQGGMKQLEGLLDKASKSRMTACTAMNEHSSRSHALFMLDIVAKHSDGVTFLRGGLRLCDLAGSERLDRTGTLNDATRLKETVNINKSLSCLADVFVSLGNKAAHIPYRNSKLTMVLQDCLSGDGKALMFVNVSPTNNSAQETLCSLRFASQVNQVELGKATKSVFSVPIQLQPVVQVQVVQPSTPALSMCGASRGGGPVRVIGSKRPIGALGGTGVTTNLTGYRDPGIVHVPVGPPVYQDPGVLAKRGKAAATGLSSNLSLSLANLSHTGATRSSQWR